MDFLLGDVLGRLWMVFLLDWEGDQEVMSGPVQQVGEVPRGEVSGESVDDTLSKSRPTCYLMDISSSPRNNGPPVNISVCRQQRTGVWNREKILQDRGFLSQSHL